MDQIDSNVFTPPSATRDRHHFRRRNDLSNKEKKLLKKKSQRDLRNNRDHKLEMSSCFDNISTPNEYAPATYLDFGSVFKGVSDTTANNLTQNSLNLQNNIDSQISGIAKSLPINKSNHKRKKPNNSTHAIGSSRSHHKNIDKCGNHTCGNKKCEPLSSSNKFTTKANARYSFEKSYKQNEKYTTFYELGNPFDPLYETNSSINLLQKPEETNSSIDLLQGPEEPNESFTEVSTPPVDQPQPVSNPSPEYHRFDLKRMYHKIFHHERKPRVENDDIHAAALEHINGVGKPQSSSSIRKGNKRFQSIRSSNLAKWIRRKELKSSTNTNAESIPLVNESQEIEMETPQCAVPSERKSHWFNSSRRSVTTPL